MEAVERVNERGRLCMMGHTKEVNSKCNGGEKEFI